MTHPSTVADTLDAGDGWINWPWPGGDCPVTRGDAVELRFRSGVEFGPCEATGASWEHNGSKGDIIAYRVLQP